MRIKPIAFNYGNLVADMPDTVVDPQRKNVVLTSKRYTMWGEHIDPEGKIMMLTSITVSRDYGKDEKTNILNEWESYLHQYVVDEQPEEILARIEDRNKKEAEKQAKARESVEKAKQKAEEKLQKLNGQVNQGNNEAAAV